MSAAKDRIMEEIAESYRLEGESEFYEKTEGVRLSLDSRMLGQIAAHVSDFANNEYDTTLLCVLRLLRDYHYTKAELAGHWLDKETQLHEGKK
jgi:hypothetical protein